MTIHVLDPKKQVAACLGCEIDQVVNGGGVAVAGTVAAGGLFQARDAASDHRVQHLLDQLLQQQVTHAHKEMEGVEKHLDELNHGKQGLGSISSELEGVEV